MLFAYGADAVYAGQPRYSLRVRNNDFDFENLKTGISEAHALGKKIYIVANIQPHNAKIKTFIEDQDRLSRRCADHVRSGMIMMVRNHFRK